jgi:hypothetical protein
VYGFVKSFPIFVYKTLFFQNLTATSINYTIIIDLIKITIRLLIQIKINHEFMKHQFCFTDILKYYKDSLNRPNEYLVFLDFNVQK